MFLRGYKCKNLPWSLAFLLWWMNLQPLQRRRSAWQARLYYITDGFVVFTAGPGFPFHDTGRCYPGPLLKTGFFAFEANRAAAWVLTHTCPGRPLSVAVNEQKLYNQPVCQLLSVKKWSGQNSLKGKILLSPVSFQRWSLLYPTPSMSQCNQFFFF